MHDLRTPPSQLRTRYDHIIVGAGAAGCILAAQLLRRESGTVLLVESGAWPTSSNLKIPSQYACAFGSQWDWNYATVPQNGLARRRLLLPAGLALGGSTAFNAMIYIRGHGKDYENWERIVGPAWSPAEVHRAFDELEHWLCGLEDSRGPVRIPSVPKLHSISLAVLALAFEHQQCSESYPRGFRQVQHGMDAYQRLQWNGRRFTAGQILSRFIYRSEPIIRDRLHVVTDTHAQSLCFDGHRCTGVFLKTDLNMQPVLANRSVALCCGAVETPRLLFSSGLGPLDELRSNGLDCRFDAQRLGSNLHDHLVYPVIASLRTAHSTFSPGAREMRVRYTQSRTGDRASNVAEIGGFFEIEPGNNTSLDSWPEFQWHITPTHYLEYPKLCSDGPKMSFGVTQLRPESRGQLRFHRGSSRNTVPVRESVTVSIDPAYLSSEHDATRMARAVVCTRARVFQGPWSSMCREERMPGVRRQSEEQIVHSIRRFASTIYHYAGACAMGLSPNSCLNEQMQFRGADRLWVCDASAMPQLVSCNPQATIMMMASRLAAWIAP